MLTMEDRLRIVEEARTWIGTPFKHQGRVKGVGVDCVGIAVCVGQNCKLDWADASGYARVPANGIFLATVQSASDPISFADLNIGDVMLFCWKSEPQHIAIVSQIEPQIRLIHAWQEIGKCVENDFDAVWKSRLVECRSYRKVNE